jgi:hypothetical protein
MSLAKKRKKFYYYKTTKHLSTQVPMGRLHVSTLYDHYQYLSALFKISKSVYL